MASARPATSAAADSGRVERPVRQDVRVTDREPGGHYRKPGWFTRVVFNRVVLGLTRLGISIWGARILRVRGRSTGEWRSVPVNVLAFEGDTYLVAPRGETQWVRNLRAAREGELVVGRRADRFEAAEVPDDEKEPILRAYLKRWRAEVGMFFDGVGPTSSSEELARIAPRHPVFRVVVVTSSR